MSTPPPLHRALVPAIVSMLVAGVLAFSPSSVPAEAQPASQSASAAAAEAVAVSGMSPTEDAPGATFHGLEPARLLDTRPADVPIGPAGTRTLGVTGVGDVPASGVEAVVLNVVATEGTADTYLRVTPTGGEIQETSSVNAERGRTVSNIVIAKVGVNGRVDIYNNAGTTHVVVDVQGWFGTSADASQPGSMFHGFDPARLMDTRSDGAPMAAAATTHLAVTGVGGVPSSGVEAVVLNVVATESTTDTYLRVTPAGRTPAQTSNVNAERQHTVSNMVIAEVGVDGQVDIYNNAGATHVVVDVQGWFGGADATGAAFHDLDPVRLLDTRTEHAPLASATTIGLHVAGLAGIPSTGVEAVVLNVVATEPTTDTYLRITPAGRAPAQTSNVNAEAQRTVSNIVIADVGADGSVDIYNNAGDTHVVVDVQGWFGPGVDTGGGIEIDPPTTTGPSSTLPPGTVPDSTIAASTVPDSTVPASTVPDSTVPESTVPASTVPQDTTTTSVPDPPDEDGTVTWVFRPAAVMLTGAGDVADVALVQIDAHGDPTGLAPPAGITLEYDNARGAIELTEQGAGAYHIVATSVLDVVVVAAHVPGQELAAGLDVSVVTLQPDVQTIPTDRIFFPPSGASAGIDAWDLVPPGVDHDHVGPFSWAELNERTNLPSGDAWTTDADTTIAGDFWFPIVLTGTAPPVGQLVVDENGRDVMGRVFEPAGAPSITRGELTLVTIHLVDFISVFRNIHVDVDYDTWIDLGLVADPSSVVAGGGAVADATGGFGRIRSTRSGAVDEILQRCTAKPTLAFTDFKLSAVQLGMHPAFSASADGLESIDYLMVQFGYDFDVTVGGSAKIVTAVDLPFECKLQDLGQAESPLPGPLALLISTGFKGALLFKGNVKAAGGPSLELSWSCALTSRLRVGFEYFRPRAEPWKKIGDFESPFKPGEDACKPSVTSTGGLSGEGGPIFGVEVNLGVSAKFNMDARIGGVLLGRLGALIGHADIGQIELVGLEFGPRMHFQYDSRGQTLFAGSSGSVHDIDLTGSMSVGFGGLEQVAKQFFGGIPISLSITLLEVVVPVVGFFRAINGTGTTAALNGAPVAAGQVDSGIEVIEGDALAFTMPQVRKAMLHPPDDEAPPTGYSLWLQEGSAYTIVDQTVAALDARLVGTTLYTDVTVTSALCRTMGTSIPRTFVVLSTSTMLGLLAASGYAGKFTLTCPPPAIDLTPASVHWSVGELAASKYVGIEGRQLGGKQWEVTRDDPAWPAWLVLDSSATGRFVGPRDRDAHVFLRVDCDAVDSDQQVSYTMRVQTVKGEIDPQVFDTIPVTADCRKKFIEFTPVTFVGSGATTLKSYGRTDATWTIDTRNFPDWLSISKDSGTFTSFAVESTSISVSVAPPEPSCDLVPTQAFAFEAVSPQRGRATFTAVRPGIAGTNDCPIVLERGDPHMRSFDGQQYDAQVLGEYTSFAPLDGQPGPTLQVRHELTAPNVVSAVSPTSVTAVALAAQGHLIEVYERPSRAVYVDGVVTDPTLDVPKELTPGLSLVETNGSVRVVGADVDLTVDFGGGILDMAAKILTDVDVRGLAGSPDGNAVNDLLGSDGHQYTIEGLWDLSRGADSDVYRFTDSWRLHDVADSLFTLGYDGFHDLNPRLDPSVLESYRVKVRAELGVLGSICAADSTSNIVEALALELAIRGEDATMADVDEFTCSYTVAGTATAPTGVGDTVQPLGGLQVTVDAIGLSPCITTTLANGTYSCSLSPDLTELTSSTPTDPELSVIARWPGQTAAAGTANVRSPALAPMGGNRQITADVAIDPVSVPAVRIAGTVIREGAPVTTPISMFIDGYDAAGGETIFLRETVTPDENGRYEVTRRMPGTTTRVVVTAITGPDVVDRFTAESTTLTPGTTTTLTIDMDLSKATIVLSGSLKLNGVPVPEKTNIWAISYDAAGQAVGYYYPSITPNPTTGAFVVSLELARTSTSIAVRVPIGDQVEYPARTFDGLVAGANARSWDIDLLVPIADVTGTISRFGVPGATDGSIRFQFYRADNTLISTWGEPARADANGHYSETRIMPSATKRVVIEYQIVGPGNDDRHVLDVSGITPGHRAFVLDADERPPTVDLSGALRQAGAPLSGPTDLLVRSYGPANVAQLVYARRTVLGAGGEFPTIRLNLPSNTRRIEVEVANANIPNGIGNVPSSRFFSLAVADVAAVQALRLDVDDHSASVHLAGHITGLNMYVGRFIPTTFTMYAGSTKLGSYTDYSESIETGGVFDQLVHLPPTVTRVQAEVLVGAFDSDHLRFDVAVTPGSAVPVELPVEFDYHPSSVYLTGRLLHHGQPYSQAEYLTLDYYDAAGVRLGGEDYRYLYVDVNGSYADQYTLLPIGTVRADVRTSHIFPDPYRVLWVTDSFTGFAPDTTTYRNFSVDFEANLRISGTMLVGGAPARDDGTQRWFFGHASYRDGDTGELTDKPFDGEVHVDASGRFRWERELVETNELGTLESIHIEYTDELGVTSSLDLDAAELGAPAVWNIGEPPAAELHYELGGHITSASDPDGQFDSDVVVTAYAFDPRDAASDPPYTVLDSTVYSVPTGDWNLAVDLPFGTTELTVTVRPSGDDYQHWTRSFRVGPAGPHELTIDADETARSFTIGGVARVDDPNDECGVDMFQFGLHFIGFADAPADDVEGDPDQWPGAIVIDRVLVVPDPATHEFGVGVEVPDGVNFIVAWRDHFAPDGVSIYPEGFGSGGWITTDITDSSWFGLGVDQVIACPLP